MVSLAIMSAMVSRINILLSKHGTLASIEPGTATGKVGRDPTGRYVLPPGVIEAAKSGNPMQRCLAELEFDRVGFPISSKSSESPSRSSALPDRLRVYS